MNEQLSRCSNPRPPDRYPTSLTTELARLDIDSRDEKNEDQDQTARPCMFTLFYIVRSCNQKSDITIIIRKRCIKLRTPGIEFTLSHVRQRGRQRCCRRASTSPGIELTLSHIKQRGRQWCCRRASTSPGIELTFSHIKQRGRQWCGCRAQTSRPEGPGFEPRCEHVLLLDFFNTNGASTGYVSRKQIPSVIDKSLKLVLVLDVK